MLVSAVSSRERDLKTAKLDDDVTLDGRAYVPCMRCSRDWWESVTTDCCTTDLWDDEIRCHQDGKHVCSDNKMSRPLTAQTDVDVTWAYTLT